MKRSILLTLVALALTRGLVVRTQEPSRTLMPVTDATLRRPVSGESIVVQPGIGYQAGGHSAELTLAAASGTAAMVFRDPTFQDPSLLVWVDRQGRVTPTAAPERGFRQPRLSPDGSG